MEDKESLLADFARMVNSRAWRSEVPTLAHSGSRDFFSIEYFDHATLDAARQDSREPRLSAATFVRLGGDETDALALLFILRELSDIYRCRVDVEDKDNPIAKLRRISIVDGRLANGLPLEAIMVRRQVFKNLGNGIRIEMFPPRALGFAFGTPEGEDTELRRWSFLVHGMRGSMPTFFEAEAEALRMHNALQRLG